MNTKFEYFFFAPLGYEYFRNEFISHPLVTEGNTLESIYGAWVIDFCRKSLNFYEHQYRLHSKEIWSEFCKHYSIPDYDSPENFGLENHWKDWKWGSGLDTHYEIKQNHTQSLIGIQKNVQKNRFLPKLFGLNKDHRREIYKIWFDKEAFTSPRVSEELRSLPYDKYLQSKHWKKVRAIMLLINSATCQAKECQIMGESWYGSSTSDIDVHHITYKNLGSERFDDVVLLCRNHHDMVHKNLEKSGSPGIEFDYT